ncbi:MAG: hypothetical protein AB7O96_02440 [Pseudobdellovibrionaceae bacterium]
MFELFIRYYKGPYDLVPCGYRNYLPYHWRTQASTASLKGQLSSAVKVIRNSKEIEIDSREIVPGAKYINKSYKMISVINRNPSATQGLIYHFIVNAR